MGAYHFKLYMFPPGSRPTRDADGDYPGGFLLTFDTPDDVVRRLRTLLPSPNHWGDVEEFNSESDWGSDLRIYHEQGGKISDIIMRFSPAGDSFDLLRKFVEIVKSARCELLVDSTGEVLPAEIQSIETAVRNHRAFRFMTDPRGAIIEAGKDTKHLNEET
jgi:hypothetical protein